MKVAGALVRALLTSSLIAAAPITNARLDFDGFEAAAGGARRALSDRQYPKAIAIFTELLQVAPRHPGLELRLADSAALQGDSPQALRAYSAVTEEGFGASVIEDPVFARFSRSPQYSSLRALALTQTEVLMPASEAFVAPDPYLVPEGVIYDEPTRRFFISSTYQRKVIAREPSGEFHDFVRQSDHGLLQALGMAIDRKRGWLMVCTGADDGNIVDRTKVRLGQSGLFVYELTSGRYLQSAWVEDTRFHLFNDLVVAPDDSVYITDSRAGQVFRFTPNRGTLSPLTAPDSLLYPNGIAMDSAVDHLFVADVVGLSRVDTQTGRVARLVQSRTISSAGIDGLYFFHGWLIGIQSDVRPNRVMAYRLNGDETAIVNARVLERDDPRMTDPTSGTIVGTSLYFIANSQQRAFTKDGVPNRAELSRSTVLKLRLDSLL